MEIEPELEIWYVTPWPHNLSKWDFRSLGSMQFDCNGFNESLTDRFNFASFKF